MILPNGSIKLLVTFDTKENFHTDYVELAMTKLHLTYNAILGRRMFYRFMEPLIRSWSSIWWGPRELSSPPLTTWRQW
jgi:hypothetical protein